MQCIYEVSFSFFPCLQEELSHVMLTVTQKDTHSWLATFQKTLVWRKRIFKLSDWIAAMWTVRKNSAFLLFCIQICIPLFLNNFNLSSHRVSKCSFSIFFVIFVKYIFRNQWYCSSLKLSYPRFVLLLFIPKCHFYGILMLSHITKN